MCEKSTSVIELNKDVEHIVNAAANIGHYGLGGVIGKRFSLLVTADVHRCRKHISRAVEYLNAMPALDAGICLGDMQGADFAENDGTWYTNEINASAKPFFTVIGNHDGGNSNRAEISGEKKQVFDKFIAPTKERIGLTELDKTYYSINFDEYKISLIVLDNYCICDERKENGDFVVSRGVEYPGQNQIDWFIKTLGEIPADYHIIVARHSFYESAVKTDCAWSIEGREPECNEIGHDGEIVPDIVNAWMNGTKIEKIYKVSPKYEGVLSPINVNADFSARGKGVFVGYIVGHEHWDWQGVSENYPEQQIHIFQSTANDTWQNLNSDLPRLEDTKADDCMTVFTVDREKRIVCMVRVGSNITNTMIDRTFASFKY